MTNIWRNPLWLDHAWNSISFIFSPGLALNDLGAMAVKSIPSRPHLATLRTAMPVLGSTSRSFYHKELVFGLKWVGLHGSPEERWGFQSFRSINIDQEHRNGCHASQEYKYRDPRFHFSSPLFSSSRKAEMNFSNNPLWGLPLRSGSMTSYRLPSSP